MIRKLLLAGCLLFVLNIVVAQRFDAGLILGFNGTQVEGDSFKGYHKAGLLAGAFVQTDVAPAVVVGMELKYSQKGSRKKYDPKEQDPYSYVMKLGYIDMPLFVAFRTNDKSLLVGGIAPGFLIHSEEIFNDESPDEPNQQDFNTFDLQPFIGFQFDFLERASIDLRFALSVIPCSDKSETNYYFHNGLYNNVISLALYYNLGLK